MLLSQNLPHELEISSQLLGSFLLQQKKNIHFICILRMSDYGDDVSEVESVASSFMRSGSWKKNRKNFTKMTLDEENIPEKDHISDKDKFELFEKFKGVIFKMLLRIKCTFLK